MAQITSTGERLEQAKRFILTTAVRPNVVMERGKGMHIWDTGGNRYLDFVGGWAVACLGHAPDALQEALSRQAAMLVTASPAFYNQPMIEFAELLAGLSGYDKVFFTCSGAEANESAIKLARKYGKRHLGGAYEIIAMDSGFHGRTLATMSATGKPAWKDLFAPKVPGFIHVPANDYAALRAEVSPQTCAIMLEPVQGEGGVRAMDKEFIVKLRELCDETGLLLIFDEIQTGIGRTGKLFASEHYGVEADIMTLGKGIGGGFPLSAMLTRSRLDLFEPGEQGGTFTGQPLGMAAGLAVVKEVVERKLPENADRQGRHIKRELERLQAMFPVANIRGMGLLLAFDLPEPTAGLVAAEAMKQGLLINAPGPGTIRLMPPLIVCEDDTAAMIALLIRALEQVFPTAGS